MAVGYGAAGTVERTAIETAFTAVSSLVIDGLWNILKVLLASVCFLAVGFASSVDTVASVF